MKITIYELLGLVKDDKAPKTFKYDSYVWTYNYESSAYWNGKGVEFEDYMDDGLMKYLNDEIETIEEKKKFTKEDFINERMEIDNITRKEFDEMYEVKECNCGMPYCKGFIAVDKEESQEHKIPSNIFLNQTDGNFYIDPYSYKQVPLKREKLSPEEVSIINKINEILDYLSKEE